MRRREAQFRCPEIAVLGWDLARDARLFEPVAAAVEELIVGVEVVRPGVVATPISGAASYFGGEAGLVELLVEHVSRATGVECQVGVADGLFAAQLAAHRCAVVERGTAAEFLAPLSVTELDQPDAGRAELVDLLRRLGLRTLGAFADLGERDVATRFGSAGVLAHRLARGHAERPVSRRRPPPELSVSETFEPPLDRIDAAAFAGRTLAERLHSGLAEHGFACTMLGIHAETERGEYFTRAWRCAEPLSPQGIADRVRWQFEGWLRAAEEDVPTAGVARLWLEPEETVEGRSLQLGLWLGDSGGEHTPEADRAGRAMVRVQGLLGPDGVCTAMFDGGRGPAERVRFVPWGDRRTVSDGSDAPWPGQLPAPSPATVFARPVPAVVTDASEAEVSMTDRHRITSAPFLVGVADTAPRRVRDWAGPWPVAARWWAPEGAGERARVQVVLAEESGLETALLLLWRKAGNPLWIVEGMYD